MSNLYLPQKLIDNKTCSLKAKVPLKDMRFRTKYKSWS